MSVSYVRPEVQAQEKRWEIVRDCIAGQEAVKAKRTTYLPQPNASDQSAANRARYDAYLERAVFYAVTERTRDGLLGQVFARDPVAEMPNGLDVIVADVDGAGVSLAQQARRTAGSVLGYGRAGLLVDYPTTSGATTKADQDAGYIRPTITQHEPWDVINWRTVTIGARKVFSLVVIRETYVRDDDGFEARTEEQFRVLRLVPHPPPEDIPEGWKPDFAQAFYRVEIWRDAEEGHLVVETYEPRDSSGKNLKEIPFTFAGALNNDPEVDQAPLYALAVLNVAHYRNSADYEEVCYLLGQPQPVIAGLTEDWAQSNFKAPDGTVKVMYGSRAPWLLPAGGSAELLQIQPNTMLKEAMEAKERQMVALGAKLVEQKQVQRTAQEAGQEAASESSILATIARNVSQAYTQCLVWAAQFMGVSGEIAYTLNSDFPASRMTPEERAQLLKEWQATGIARSEYRTQLKKAGIAQLDDEAYKDEIESDPPAPAFTGDEMGGPGAPEGDDEEEAVAA